MANATFENDETALRVRAREMACHVAARRDLALQKWTCISNAEAVP